MAKLLLILSFLFAALLWSPPAFSEGVFTLPQLSTTQTDPVFRTLAAGFFYRPVEPASDFGALGGFSLGVAVNGVSTSAVSTIFTGMSTPFLPTAMLMGAVGLPKGITLEAGFVPSLNYQGSTFSNLAFGAKWTLTRSVFAKWPVDVALRANYTSAGMSYTQNITGGTVAVRYGSGIFSADLVASYPLPILEPFIGLGFITDSSSLTGTGTASLFGASFPVGTTTYSEGRAAPWLYGGVKLHLTLVKISASYDFLYGISSWSLKAGISI
jgi:hypothetical protein